MVERRSRRSFLTTVGRGTLLATVGPALAVDMGLVPRGFAEDAGQPLQFEGLEPLIAMMQETPVERLQAALVSKLQSGLPLKTLVAAGALANARTFGGEDYIGFHTFMALSPALKMSAQMPQGSEALPVFKVLYRNTKRIHEHGGRASETLRSLTGSPSVSEPSESALHEAIRSKDINRAEQILSALVTADPRSGLDALIPTVQDNPEVHRTVLPYRAWEMQDIVGTQHALTLLRQSLHYCLKAEAYRRADWDDIGKMLTSLLDEFHLNGKHPGTANAEDAFVQHLSQTFATSTPLEAARAAASALSEGFQPGVIGEAISLAASLLVLRDGGRLPQYEERLKPAGSVHGDSVGVHASDTANAWRNMAQASSGRNVYACLIIGAWQVARDRSYPGNLLAEPLPVTRHLNQLSGLDADALLVKLDEAVQDNLQSHATAAVRKLSETSIAPERIFSTLLRYAVSEDGALHAEKYFYTVWDDFHTTRPSARWQHLLALSRVTASEFGKPAAGQDEARKLLGLS